MQFIFPFQCCCSVSLVWGRGVWAGVWADPLSEWSCSWHCYVLSFALCLRPSALPGQLSACGVSACNFLFSVGRLSLGHFLKVYSTALECCFIYLSLYVAFSLLCVSSYVDFLSVYCILPLFFKSLSASQFPWMLLGGEYQLFGC